MKKIVLRIYNYDRQFFKVLLILGTLWLLVWIHEQLRG